MFEGIIAMAKENLKNGIPVGLGTDTACPYVTQYDMWRELCYYAKFCGVSNAFALYSATLLNAELAGIGGETGSIKRGKRAEMIVVRKNLLEDLRALRTPEMVIMGERLIRAPRVKKIPEVEAELDKWL